MNQLLQLIRGMNRINRRDYYLGGRLAVVVDFPGLLHHYDGHQQLREGAGTQVLAIPNRQHPTRPRLNLTGTY